MAIWGRLKPIGDPAARAGGVGESGAFRRTQPGRARVFRVPAVGLVAGVAILGCLWFFASLPTATQLRFCV